MTSSSFKEGFGDRLRAARERAGLTLRELGESARIDYSQISRYEQGLALPRPGTVIRLAAVLAVPPEHLREGTDIRLVDLERPDGTLFAKVSFSDAEFAEFQRASDLSGVPVEDVIKNIILTGMGKTGLNRMK